MSRFLPIGSILVDGLGLKFVITVDMHRIKLYGLNNDFIMLHLVDEIDPKLPKFGVNRNISLPLLEHRKEQNKQGITPTVIRVDVTKTGVDPAHVIPFTSYALCTMKSTATKQRIAFPDKAAEAREKTGYYALDPNIFMQIGIRPDGACICLNNMLEFVIFPKPVEKMYIASDAVIELPEPNELPPYAFTPLQLELTELLTATAGKASLLDAEEGLRHQMMLDTATAFIQKHGVLAVAGEWGYVYDITTNTFTNLYCVEDRRYKSVEEYEAGNWVIQSETQSIHITIKPETIEKGVRYKFSHTAMPFFIIPDVAIVGGYNAHVAHMNAFSLSNTAERDVIVVLPDSLLFASINFSACTLFLSRDCLFYNNSLYSSTYLVDGLLYNDLSLKTYPFNESHVIPYHVKKLDNRNDWDNPYGQMQGSAVIDGKDMKEYMGLQTQIDSMRKERHTGAPFFTATCVIAVENACYNVKSSNELTDGSYKNLLRVIPTVEAEKEPVLCTVSVSGKTDSDLTLQNFDKLRLQIIRNKVGMHHYCCKDIKWLTIHETTKDERENGINLRCIDVRGNTKHLNLIMPIHWYIRLRLDNMRDFTMSLDCTDAAPILRRGILDIGECPMQQFLEGLSIDDNKICTYGTESIVLVYNAMREAVLLYENMGRQQITLSGTSIRTAAMKRGVRPDAIQTLLNLMQEVGVSI